MTEPELTKEFISVTKRHAPLADISLLSNGLLVPNVDSDFWNVLVNNNIWLRITAYPATMPKWASIVETLEAHGVNYVYHVTRTFERRLTLERGHDIFYNSQHCGSSGCHYVRNGYIYKCPDASLIKHLDKAVGTNFESKCGISIDEAEQNPIEALDRLTDPIDLCSYCDTKNRKWLRGETVHGKPDLNDWLI